MTRPTPDDQILAVLTRRQYTHPHASITDVLADAVDEIGCCPFAVNAAVVWLQVDPNRSIGRLRRTELTQLARSIERLWRQSVGVER